MKLVYNIQSKFQNASEVESDVLWRMEESFEASFLKPWYSGDDDEPTGLVLQGPRSQHAAVCRPQLPPCRMFCLASETVFCSFVHGRILLCSLLVSYQGSLQAFGGWLACQDPPVSLCVSFCFILEQTGFFTVHLPSKALSSWSHTDRKTSLRKGN